MIVTPGTKYPNQTKEGTKAHVTTAELHETLSGEIGWNITYRVERDGQASAHLNLPLPLVTARYDTTRGTR